MPLTYPDSPDTNRKFIPANTNPAKLPAVSIHVPGMTGVTAESAAYLAANGISGFASTGAKYDGLMAVVAVERVNISMGLPLIVDRQHIFVKGEGSIRRYWDATNGNAWNAVVSPAVVVNLNSDTATITEAAGFPTGGAAGDHRVDFAGNVVYKNTAGTWAVLRSATASQVTLVPLTGATTLYADLHGTAAGFQITYNGANAALTLATDSAAIAAGHSPWFPGNSVDIVTLDSSSGSPTLTTPDGKTVVGAPTKEIGGLCKASNSWTVGTTDPTAVPAGAALTAGSLAQFASTTSAQLLGIISDETGTGPLVFGTSPTISAPNLSRVDHHFETFATFQAAVAAEQARVAAGKALWVDGTRLNVGTAPNTVTMIWSVANNHARLATFGSGKTASVTADSNVVLFGSGVPASGTGANGDLYVDWAVGVYGPKVSGAWPSTLAFSFASTSAPSGVLSGGTGTNAETGDAIAGGTGTTD